MNTKSINATFFPTAKDFRKWLEKNHKKETELLVGYYKVNSGRSSISWSESVDQALCFGWIDGIRRSIDNESYCIRFTPRKKNSIWSSINIKKVEELQKAGLMTEAGLEAFSHKKDHRTKVYSHEKEPDSLAKKYEQQFRKNKKAWNFFIQQAPSYKKLVVHWVMSAKQEKTQLSRLERAIKECEEKGK